MDDFHVPYYIKCQTLLFHPQGCQQKYKGKTLVSWTKFKIRTSRNPLTYLNKKLRSPGASTYTITHLRPRESTKVLILSYARSLQVSETAFTCVNRV